MRSAPDFPHRSAPLVLVPVFLLTVLLSSPTVSRGEESTPAETTSTSTDAFAGSSAEPTTAEAPATETTNGPTERTEGETARDIVYERMTVIGNADAARRIPGSAHVVGLAELEKQRHSDIHRILRQVPGVNIQEEDGFGLRPNIGIRGTGVERSQKVTLLEDGVLIAPAPYSAPSAYYSPTAGRMETIEVRKGSAAIRQGPYTNGGVINYVSTSIPGEPSGRLDLSGGDHGMFKLHASAGASGERYGFVVETFQQTASGFKRLDGGGDTGFDLSDYLVKARLASAADARWYQQLEIKLGKTEQDGNETYLGLTRDDFRTNPYRRYRASALDHLDADHEQLQLQYFLRPNERFDLTTTLYRNDFFRNWYKNERTLGISNGSILDDPLTFATELAMLRGEIDSPDDAFTLRANRRDYYAQGIQSVLGVHFGGDRARHDLQVGMRWHEDEEDRFQEDDRYALRDGRLVLTTPGAPGSQSNRIGQAESLALFVEDQIALGRFTLTPGLRFESIDTQRLDYGGNDPERSGVSLATRENSHQVFLPGLGLDVQLEGGWSLFGSIHRGFSPPGPSSREPVEPEESMNYEMGTRFGRGATTFEAVLFFNDYSNLLGADTLSSGGTGTGDQFNGGAVDVHGLELGFNTPLVRRDRFRIPLRLSYTLTEAEFGSSFTTDFEDWAPEVTQGDTVPYIPSQQLFAEIGVETKHWNAYLDLTWVDAMRTKAGQGPAPEGQQIDSHVTVDFSTNLTLRERYRLFLQVRNLTDKDYVAALRPYGLRPGLPRTTLLGFAVDF